MVPSFRLMYMYSIYISYIYISYIYIIYIYHIYISYIYISYIEYIYIYIMRYIYIYIYILYSYMKPSAEGPLKPNSTGLVVASAGKPARKTVVTCGRLP